MKKIRVLILVVTTVLGNAMYRVFSKIFGLVVYGNARSERARRNFSSELSDRLLIGFDVKNNDYLERCFTAALPDMALNCVGNVEQLADANYPLQAISVNTLLPHRLAALGQVTRARHIQISTDCVFSGTKDKYLKPDVPDEYNPRSNKSTGYDAPDWPSMFNFVCEFRKLEGLQNVY